MMQVWRIKPLQRSAQTATRNLAVVAIKWLDAPCAHEEFRRAAFVARDMGFLMAEHRAELATYGPFKRLSADGDDQV